MAVGASNRASATTPARWTEWATEPLRHRLISRNAEPSNRPAATADVNLQIEQVIGLCHVSTSVRRVACTCDTDPRSAADQVQLLRSGLDELFGASASGRGYAAAFFPSRVRNPVLEAGAGRKLLAVTYGGITRIVEPYSLTFKRRQDGGGQEYLHVWDRTGGRSGPGIKTFIHSKISAVCVLDETFEPRFSIELSKSGDIHTAGRFTASRSTSRASGRSSRRHPQFVVECSYCGKRFRRTKPSAKINKHKDPDGRPCSGRTGYRVQ